MPSNGKGSSWRHCRLVTSHHATWSCLLSVSNALSTAYLLSFSIVEDIPVGNSTNDQPVTTTTDLTYEAPGFDSGNKGFHHYQLFANHICVTIE